MNTGGAHPPLGELSGSESEKQGGSGTRTGATRQSYILIEDSQDVVV